MFTTDQIKHAHSKVKSGADFPNYIRDITKLGVTGYSTYVTDSHTEFSGANNYKIKSEAKYPPLTIALMANPEKFKQALKKHQQGSTDYFTFCKDCAENGVEKWMVDTTEMTCTYFDKAGVIVLLEKIPGSKNKN